jgi:hypothetical protein
MKTPTQIENERLAPQEQLSGKVVCRNISVAHRGEHSRDLRCIDPRPAPDENDHADDCTDPNCRKRHTISAARPAQPQAPAEPWRSTVTCTYQAPYCCGKPAVVRLIWVGPTGIAHSEAPAFCGPHTEIWRKEKNDWWREELIAPAAAPSDAPPAHIFEAAALICDKRANGHPEGSAAGLEARKCANMIRSEYGQRKALAEAALGAPEGQPPPAETLRCIRSVIRHLEGIASGQGSVAAALNYARDVETALSGEGALRKTRAPATITASECAAAPEGRPSAQPSPASATPTKEG